MTARPTDNLAHPDYAALREKAYRLLARREHSAWELRRKLQSRQRFAATSGDNGDDETTGNHDAAGNYDIAECIETVLAELAEAGAQSDARFAAARGRLAFQSGRGPRKLQADLRQHCIDADVMESVMAKYTGKWRDLAAQVREKKFGAAPGNYREWAKQARFLQQRGFAADEIEPYG